MMTSRDRLPRFFALLLLCAAAFCGLPARLAAQEQRPLTKAEFLQLLHQLPKRPSLKQELINQVRSRGVDFEFDSGLRSLVATKSGNDADLRRTVEEAVRRRANPTAAALPSSAEAVEVLARAREAARAAAEAMPDFVVKQLITRAVAQGTTRNFSTMDRLAVGVSYRASGGEKYRLLARNGVPVPEPEAGERGDYAGEGGSSSTGEYVTLLSLLFSDEYETAFRPVDTDTLRGRRTLVYEFEVKQPKSKETISYNNEQTAVVGSRGRIWVDRENYRVLRIDSTATDIPAGFPITATSRAIDYDWVEIAERAYLLPSRATVEMSVRQRAQLLQTRNTILFRGYQKYGTEIRVIEEDIVDDESELPAKKP